MPDTKLAAKSKVAEKLTNVSVRESIAKLKKSVIDSQAFEDLLFVAKTGNLRRVEISKTGDTKETVVPVSDDQQIDCLKFIVNKVIPNARATEDTGDAEQLQKWAAIIQGEASGKTEKTP